MWYEQLLDHHPAALLLQRWQFRLWYFLIPHLRKQKRQGNLPFFLFYSAIIVLFSLFCRYYHAFGYFLFVVFPSVSYSFHPTHILYSHL